MPSPNPSPRELASLTAPSASASKRRAPYADTKGGKDKKRRKNAREGSEEEHTPKEKNFDVVRCGEYVVDVWYYSPYPQPPTQAPSHAPLSSSSRRSITPLPPHLPPHSNTSPQTTSLLPPTQPQAGPSSSRTSLTTEPEDTAPPPKRQLWVCDQCFKHKTDVKSYFEHVEKCDMNFPPGRKVYQYNSQSIWEIDGRAQKLYCQNISLFGKLFIDHKTIFFDVEDFLFYVLTESTSKRDHPMAFFSKEKVSTEDCNLACIMTFPQFQRDGFGRLLMEFSYYLTLPPHSSSPGTPERPLSHLGRRSYESFWARVTLRTLVELMIEGWEEGVGAARERREREARAREARERERVEREARERERVEREARERWERGEGEWEGGVIVVGGMGRAGLSGVGVGGSGSGGVGLGGAGLGVVMGEREEREMRWEDAVKRRRAVWDRMKIKGDFITALAFQPPPGVEESLPELLKPISLSTLSVRAHIRLDDLHHTLLRLGFLHPPTPPESPSRPAIPVSAASDTDDSSVLSDEDGVKEQPPDLGPERVEGWRRVEVGWDVVLRGCEEFGARARGVLVEDKCMIRGRERR